MEYFWINGSTPVFEPPRKELDPPEPDLPQCLKEQTCGSFRYTKFYQKFPVL